MTISVFLYGSEYWPLTKQETNRKEAGAMRVLKAVTE
jgi:hypothetical protein